MELYTKSCNGGIGSSCYRLGNAYYVGDIASHNIGLAVKNYTLACTGKIGKACTELGTIYRVAYGVKTNLSLSKDYYGLGCAYGDPAGCSMYGANLINAKDESSVAFIRESCNKNDPFGCGLLGALYNDGLFVKKDLQQANSYFNKAMSLMDQQCYDRDLSLTSYQSCELLYGQLLSKRNKNEGENYLLFYANNRAESCAKGNLHACYQVGSIFHVGQGAMGALINNGQGVLFNSKGIKKNHYQAEAYYTKACNGNHMVACNNLALLYTDELGGFIANLAAGSQLPKNYSKGVELLNKACNADFGESCYMLGLYALKGKVLRKDSQYAMHNLKKACNLGFGAACNEIGDVFYKGRIVKKDINTALSYYKAGCGYGFENACKNYERRK